MRFQVLTATSMKMTVFRDVTPCSLVDVCRRFRGACCLQTRLHGAASQKTVIFITLIFWTNISCLNAARLRSASRTNSMGHNIACQEIVLILWHLKVHFRVQKTLPLVPVTSQMNPVHIFTLYFHFIFTLFTFSSHSLIPLRFSVIH
jgi:hypothetical protein